MERTILVADDDPDVTHALAVRLRGLGLSVVRSPDATHALVGVQRMRPDLVILDVNMPGGNGLAVAEMLATDEEFRNTPVIIHTGRDDELTQIRCCDPHHFYVKKAPESWQQIKAIVCRELKLGAEPAVKDDSPPAAAAERETEPLALPTDAGAGPLAPASSAMAARSNGASAPRASERAQPTTVDMFPDLVTRRPAGAGDAPPRLKVLCIDDDPDISKAIKLRLEPYNIEVLRAFNGMHGYWTAVGERPDAIICDMNMPEGDGNYIISRLKSHPLTQNVPVFLLTGQSTPALKRTMLCLGVEACLTKPLVFDELLRGLRQHFRLPDKPSVR